MLSNGRLRSSFVSDFRIGEKIFLGALLFLLASCGFSQRVASKKSVGPEARDAFPIYDDSVGSVYGINLKFVGVSEDTDNHIVDGFQAAYATPLPGFSSVDYGFPASYLMRALNGDWTVRPVKEATQNGPGHLIAQVYAYVSDSSGRVELEVADNNWQSSELPKWDISQVSWRLGEDTKRACPSGHDYPLNCRVYEVDLLSNPSVGTVLKTFFKREYQTCLKGPYYNNLLSLFAIVRGVPTSSPGIYKTSADVALAHYGFDRDVQQGPWCTVGGTTGSVTGGGTSGTTSGGFTGGTTSGTTTGGFTGGTTSGTTSGGFTGGTTSGTATGISTGGTTGSAGSGTTTGDVVGGNPPPRPPQPDCGVLHAGQQLTTGQSITSCDGRYTLRLQPDGNLVVIGPSGPLWSTVTGTLGHQTYGTTFGPNATGDHLSMQRDGNLVLLRGGAPTWHSQTWGYSNSELHLQNDSNLVTYQVRSDGGLTPTWSWFTGNLVGRRCGTLTAGQSLSAGQSITSCDGRYRLTMQFDGNLVEYGPTGAIWSTLSGPLHSGSAGTRYGASCLGNFAIMQSDGNFVLYQNGQARWDSGTWSTPAELVLQQDSNLVVYSLVGGSRIPKWSWMTGRL